MRVLGIETTCDETAVAIVEERLGFDGGEILANEVMSQIARHAAYGGVVPEIAARAHIEVLDRLILRALRDARTDIAGVDAIAAAAGPGLIGGILVGLTTGKALAMAAGKPFVAVNHLEAHALTARLTDGIDFPYLALIVSGGHTQLVAVRGVGAYQRLGSTVDDAAGEAFDKVGKMLDLPYPGGPAIEKLAADGDPRRFDLPRPMLGRANADFSLSGLKTAVRQELLRLGEEPSETDKRDLAASFQAAVVDVIVDRVRAGSEAFRRAGRVVAGRGREPARPRHRRRRRRQRRHSPGAHALLRRGGAAFRRPRAGAVLRQWRDDRLGRAGALQAGARRQSRFRRPSALAARRQPRRSAPRQGLNACVHCSPSPSRASRWRRRRRPPDCSRENRSSRACGPITRRAPGSRASTRG